MPMAYVIPLGTAEANQLLETAEEYFTRLLQQKYDGEEWLCY